MNIKVTKIGKSDCVDTPGAIDATVVIDGESHAEAIGDESSGRYATPIEGEVTLVPREYDGVLDSWGDLDHWASQSLHDLTHEALREMVAAAREAAKDMD